MTSYVIRLDSLNPGCTAIVVNEDGWDEPIARLWRPTRRWALRSAIVRVPKGSLVSIHEERWK